jgi:hypothetical protein
MAQGGRGVIISDCPTCKKQFGTNTRYLEHLADDVLPVILRTVFKIAAETTDGNS